MSLEDGDLDEFVQVAKRWVEKGDIQVLQESIQFVPNQDIPTLFHRVYIHACLKQKKEIAEYLETIVFPTLCPIQQIALRQIFPYGRYLLAKK